MVLSEVAAPDQSQAMDHKQPVTVIHATADATPLIVMRNCSDILLQKFS